MGTWISIILIVLGITIIFIKVLPKRRKTKNKLSNYNISKPSKESLNDINKAKPFEKQKLVDVDTTSNRNTRHHKETSAKSTNTKDFPSKVSDHEFKPADKTQTQNNIDFSPFELDSPKNKVPNHKRKPIDNTQDQQDIDFPSFELEAPEDNISNREPKSVDNNRIQQDIYFHSLELEALEKKPSYKNKKQTRDYRPDDLVEKHGENHAQDQPIRKNISTNIKLCLFDLDQTLLRTDDLEELRGSDFIGVNDHNYSDKLRKQFKLLDNRHIYTPNHLTSLRQRFPDMYWGVFTRSPHHYAEVLLSCAYPGLNWNCLVAYEDVKRTKPAGYGVQNAMQTCEINSPSEVLLIGDSYHDIQAGYHAECWTVLDKSSWEHPHARQHYPAYELIPDAIIDQPSMLEPVIINPVLALPELEYQLASIAASRSEPRFDRINYIPSNDKRNKVIITVLGRYFTGKQYQHPSGNAHQLTQQILNNKDSVEFPDAWIQAIRQYLKHTCKNADPIVTVIPFKHGRSPRLEILLKQVESSNLRDPIRPNTRYDFQTQILSFKENATSSHKRSLNEYQRFTQVTDNLYVSNPQYVTGRPVIVFDDVVTTGASLITARHQLKQAGASRVSCMALAKTINRIKQ